VTNLLRLLGPGRGGAFYGWRDWDASAQDIESNAPLRRQLLFAIGDDAPLVQTQAVARSVEARIAAIAALAEGEN
jgi:hypothetical protein